MVVLRCDASDALATTECNYIKTVGTSYESSVEESMSISQGDGFRFQHDTDAGADGVHHKVAEGKIWNSFIAMCRFQACSIVSSSDAGSHRIS